MSFRRPILCIALGLALRLPAAGADLSTPTASITLTDAFAGRQLVVSAADRDVTREAKYATDNPSVAHVGTTGYVTPAGNGSTMIRVSHAGGQLTISVTVWGIGATGRPVDFRTEVMPLLSKLGCNAGGCHGKASGQNGFKLSLFGFDTTFDYAAIVKEARGRRLFPAAPDHSLFLLKASGQVPHGGGNRLVRDSADYQVVRQWIAAGAPASSSSAPRVKSLRVIPGDRVLKRDGWQQLAVLAEYTDGTTRDVTRQSEFASNLDVVASADATGLVQAHQLSGEAAIMARHMGHVAVFRALVPHGEPLADIPEFKPINYVDKLAIAKWKKLGLRPSPTVDDATFLRRVTVDLCGRLPTEAEVRGFAADAGADKRVKLVDHLLDSPDYPAYFALRWGSILRNSNLAGADQAAYAFHGWIKDMIARNRAYDEFVRGVVAAAGEWQDAPAINWYWQNRDDQLHQVTADVAQVFLGIRLQCAKCHHHPYERWGQADYYGLAGFFTRLGRKNFGQPPPYYASATVTTGEKDPLTGKAPEPKYPDGDSPIFTAEDDPRHALVDWMAKPDNPFFAKALVNRLWGHFLGRGLYHEVDDQRDTNPPSNPELLDALAKDFVAHKFDMKHVIRTIVTSRVYQLRSTPTDGNKDDRQNFARYYARRMPAEVFLDALNQATGSKAGFNGVGTNGRAVDLPHEGFGSYFLDTFDRPKRVTVCECERFTGATLSQVLLLANSEEIENKIAAGDGRIAKLMKDKRPLPAAIEELYLSALSRPPTDAEKNKTLSYVDQQSNKQQALEDVLWALLNSKEFMFNH
jgi:Protein of unknown function (DUF1553)/Protein of unknown function (DUF1549)